MESKFVDDVPILDRAGRGIGRRNSTLVGCAHTDYQRTREEINYLRKIGARPTAVVCEHGAWPIIYCAARKRNS